MTTPSAARAQDHVAHAADVETIRADFLAKLAEHQGKFAEVATTNDHFLSLAQVVRDRLLARWVRTAQTYLEHESRTVAYLSAEYLLGPQLGINLLYLGMMDNARRALASLQISLDALLEHEEEPGLGNGGLGRLAACFMDSLATRNIPAIGYGIRYEYGIFDQAIVDGQQVERADQWLRLGYPWEVPRPEIFYPVGFGGSTHHYKDDRGRYRVSWRPARVVHGMAYDTPVLGYATQTANFLRLWHSIAPKAFDFEAFNSGDYYRAVEDKVNSETITKVLYPNDTAMQGKRLRLEQQYLLVSCSLRDMIRLCKQREVSLTGFHEKFAAQLNDTHPALAVAELMRLLVDEHEMSWEDAWHITTATFGYTNHTLLAEALETWSVPMFGSLLPRHLEIIYEINRRFLDEVRAKCPGDEARAQRMSLIDERGERAVRMAHLACVGSHAINGVAELHSSLLRKRVFRDFAELYPERFFNVTNGVTPRRFIALSNPALARLISDAIGERWLTELDELQRLEPFAADAAFRSEMARIKRANKERLAAHIRGATGQEVDPDTLFDVQVKRIHEYKRQLLNVLHILALYQRIAAGSPPESRRTFVFAGKAAPSYVLAKLVIRLIHDASEAIRRHPEASRWLSVVFVPDFNVKVAERIYPAADLSEQISLAGKEASGTGNMKLAMNGALTIGTLDGANVEIRERVGAELFYLFGLTAEEAYAVQHNGYHPSDVARRDPELSSVLDLIASGQLAHGHTERYEPLLRSLLDHDEYLVLADYRAYIAAQERVGRDFVDREEWTRRTIATVARTGSFSSDRSIEDYCRDIWHVSRVSIAPPAPNR